MAVLIGIILFLAVLGADLYFDYKKWISLRRVNHTLKAWQRAVCLIPSGILLHINTPNPNIFGVIPVFTLMFFTYWLLFDGFYNVLRGYKWWFLGSDDWDDAKLDDLQQVLGLRLSKVLKIGGLIISLFFYIKLWL